MKEEIKKALRALVAAMYENLYGAYGGKAYEGWYEKEISDLAEIICEIKK